MPSRSVEYERLVKDLLTAQMPEEMSGVEIRTFHNRHYEGKSGHRHQIDVAVEMQIATLDILILVECKAYKRKVGIDDVMELAGRIDDIGAHKGLVVTTVGFERGAVKFAAARGIALATATAFQWLAIEHCYAPGRGAYVERVAQEQIVSLESLIEITSDVKRLRDAIDPSGYIGRLNKHDVEIVVGDYREVGLVTDSALESSGDECNIRFMHMYEGRPSNYFQFHEPEGGTVRVPSAEIWTLFAFRDRK